MSKRTSIFGQGKPENPYEERDEGPIDTPKKATAAQMATRKIKAAKGSRRPAGASSGLSATPSFGPPQASGFGFGGDSTVSANPFGFLSQSQQQSTPNGGDFGNDATSSFPPTQSSTASNTFTTSSFPAFGGGGQTTGFHPQPPSTGFNFTAATNNAFGAPIPAPTMNGSGNSGFTASMFNIPPSQPKPGNTPFGGEKDNTSTTAAPSTLFGTSAAPQTNLFGGLSSSAPSNVATTTAPSSNLFSSLASAPSSSAPANNLFGFAPTASAAHESTPAPKPVLFGSISSAAQNNATTSTTPASTSFSGFGMSTQQDAASTAAPAGSLFQSIGGTPGPSGSTPAPSNGFSFLGASTQGAATSTPGPATSMFKGFGASSQPEASWTAAATSSPFKGFGASTQSQTPTTPAPASSLFSMGKPAEKEVTNTPASNPFTASVPTNNFFSGFGSTPQTSRAATTAPGSTSLNAATPAKTNLFSLGTPQTSIKEPESSTRETEVEAPKKGLFSASNVPRDSGIFSQPAKPESLSKNAFAAFSSANKKSEATKSTSSNIFTQQSQAAGPKSDAAQKASFSFPSQTPFAPATSLSGAADSSAQKKDLAPPKEAQQSASQSFFRPSSPSKEQAPLSPASAMPTLTGAAAPPATATQPTQQPKLPKARVPQNWSTSKVPGSNLNELSLQLAKLNEKYRARLAQLPATADWTLLSSWHYKESGEIMDKIVAIRKQQAAAKGITGNESSLSTKRKADDGVNRQNQDASPSKKARGVDVPSTPTPKPSSILSTTPKAAPPATQTSNLFGNILGKGNAPVSTTTSTPAVGSIASDKKEPEPSKGTTSQTGFMPTLGASKASDSSTNRTSQSPFQFLTSGTKGETKQTENKVSSFSSIGSESPFSQFAKSAKTFEQLRAERKAKAKEEDYDSDEESEEQWSARWDKEEAARIAEKKAQADQEFAFGAPEKKTSGTTTASNPFSGLSQPASGTSTPGLFSSRLGSPAPSATRSVFDTPNAAQTPSSNIFGHLSSGASSNNQDEDEDEDEDENEDEDEDEDEDEYEEEEQSESQPQSDQPSDFGKANKRKLAASESESEESLEEMMRRKKQQASGRPSLMSRITKTDDSEAGDESDKENGNTSKAASVFGQTNGVQTPNKPFQFFDFEKAGGQTAPPKSEFFAGDQTFKPGSPIVFGTQKKDAPTFQFQPATPSPAEFSATPSKPPPFSLFNQPSGSTPSWLTPTTGQSGPGSIASSVLSSRAATPLSEAETSGKDSAGENDGDEGTKQEQLDLSGLTDDEKSENDILFHAEQALAKEQQEKTPGKKTWENLARGPLWILKNKESGKAFVRIRLASGKTALNYNILPKLKTNVTGNSKKMVSAVRPGEGGKLKHTFFALKTNDIAEEFSRVYNESLPSS